MKCDAQSEACFSFAMAARRIAMYVRMYVCMVITYSKSMDQPGKIANPARGQLNRGNKYFIYFSVPVRA